MTHEKPATYNIQDHKVVTQQQWLAAGRELLEKEKEFNRVRDELNQARRDLPWEAVTKAYVFEGPKGKQPLPELFDGRSSAYRLPRDVWRQDTAGNVFHTYSTFARGVDLMNTAYNYLDLAPKGRDEAGHPNPQFWVGRRDEYGKLSVTRDRVPARILRFFRR